MKTIILAFLVLLVGSAAVSAKELNELECYATKQLARQAFPKEHLRHKELPEGICWHKGHWREGISIVTRPTPKGTGSVQSSDHSTPKKTLHLKDWKTAVPLTPDEFYAYKWGTWEWASPW